MIDPVDEKFMRRALAEARKGIGRVSPNPAVGAVLVSSGTVLGTGFHRAPGKPHAEVECLSAVPAGSAKGATLYVTLEPCSTTGRTPPCTDAIVAAGIKRVVVGATDPNPRHRGRGLDLLTAAGVEITTGVLAEECTQLNEGFNKWITTGRPFVLAKCGMSLDGRLTRPSDEPRWITGPAARRHAMQLRAQVDAILIGAQTLRTDNPRLTVRGCGAARQPWRVVLTRSGKLPPHANVFTDRFRDRTLVYRRKTLAQVLADLGQREITTVLIEGGGEVLGEAFDARVVDKVQFYIAPLLTGGPVAAVSGKGALSTATGARLEQVRFENAGPDIVVTGYPRWQ
jgi:diaminohydroxyphosphoribosylaminopyrimidine deaminase/5-amino-6-(5-phosphoribosylamino)uracil reductase